MKGHRMRLLAGCVLARTTFLDGTDGLMQLGVVGVPQENMLALLHTIGGMHSGRLRSGHTPDTVGARTLDTHLAGRNPAASGASPQQGAPVAFPSKSSTRRAALASHVGLISLTLWALRVVGKSNVCVCVRVTKQTEQKQQHSKHIVYECVHLCATVCVFVRLCASPECVPRLHHDFGPPPVLALRRGSAPGNPCGRSTPPRKPSFCEFVRFKGIESALSPKAQRLGGHPCAHSVIPR